MRTAALIHRYALFNLNHTNSSLASSVRFDTKLAHLSVRDGSTSTTTKSSSAQSGGSIRPKDKQSLPNTMGASGTEQACNISSTPQATKYTLALSVSPQLTRFITHLRRTCGDHSLTTQNPPLALFSSLPPSKLESTAAAVASIAARTQPYKITADLTQIRRRAVCVGVQSASTLRRSKNLRDDLLKAWTDFAAPGGEAPISMYWTVTSPINAAQERNRIERQVKSLLKARWKGPPVLRSDVKGMVTGLSLWPWSNGAWLNPMNFPFRDQEHVTSKLVQADAEGTPNHASPETDRLERWRRENPDKSSRKLAASLMEDDKPPY